MCQAFLEILILHIPSYIFILSFIIRFFAIKNHIYQAQRLQTHWLDDDTSPHRNRYKYLQKSISLLLKIAFSQILAFLYIIELLIGFFVSENMKLISCQKYFSFSFVIGFCSWWMSASLLRLEFEKELSQACYTHRLFWFFSFFLGIIDLITTQVIRKIFPLKCYNYFIGVPFELHFQYSKALFFGCVMFVCTF